MEASNDADELEDDGLTLAARKRVGDVLNDKWRLDQLLGVGGMAAVYAATHRNGNRVAVKLLHPHCVVNDGIRMRFQREGYVANKIEHPGSVRVLDDDRTSDGAVFLVMELLEGETLEARLARRGRLPADEALSIVYHLLDVLGAAHGKGVVHRDIKLDNVFLTRAGEVKVLDFGIARLAEASPQQQSVAKTRTNAMMGTPAFMAPEQALGRAQEVDGQTDVWAVGATLFKLLTGRNVHEASTLNEQLVHAATKPAPPLQSVLSDAPAQLAAVVDRALAFSKRDRWPDALAMMEAMRPLVRASTSGQMPPVRGTSFVTERGPTMPLMASVVDVAPVSTSRTVSARDSAPPRRMGLVLGLIGLGVVAAVGVWVVVRRQPPPTVAGAGMLPAQARAAGGAAAVAPPAGKPAPLEPAGAAAGAAGAAGTAIPTAAAGTAAVEEPRPQAKPRSPRPGADRGKPAGAGRPGGDRPGNREAGKREAGHDDMWDRRH